MAFTVVHTPKHAARLAQLGNLDATPLVTAWEGVLREDNRRGLLAGLDVRDHPMPATVREKTPSISRRKGTGPPLLPRGERSRAIKNARTGHGRRGNDWFAVLAWQDFTTRSGLPLLPLHLTAVGGRPRRDVITQIRPTGQKRATAEFQAWLKAALAKTP